MSDDDLEGDEFVERVGDLIEKIGRDINEGGYSPYTALPALADVIVNLCLASDDPNESLRRFMLHLLQLFADFWPPPDAHYWPPPDDEP